MPLKSATFHTLFLRGKGRKKKKRRRRKHSQRSTHSCFPAKPLHTCTHSALGNHSERLSLLRRDSKRFAPLILSYINAAILFRLRVSFPSHSADRTCLRQRRLFSVREFRLQSLILFCDLSLWLTYMIPSFVFLAFILFFLSPLHFFT